MTTTSMPAAAPYAAADADVLPVEAQMMARAALLDGLGDGHDHAAVLERAGRVLALDLEVAAAGTPIGAAERPGMARAA